MSGPILPGRDRRRPGQRAVGADVRAGRAGVWATASTRSPRTRTRRPGRWPTARWSRLTRTWTLCRDFARQVAVVTFEFENVPAETADAVAAIVPVRPGGAVLHIAQNRLREKTWLAQHGIPCAPFRHVATRAELGAALDELGFPAILKTAGFGYDGKGQARINSPDDANNAWGRVGRAGVRLGGLCRL